MTLPLSRRIERAFAADYLPRHLAISGLNIYEAHGRLDAIEFPSLEVYSEDAQQHPDMPTITGVKVVRLRLKFTVDNADGRGNLDDWKSKLEDVMTDQARVLSELNKPLGVDRRKVCNIHIYDVMPSGEPSDVNETDWVEDMLFDVICQKM